MISMSIESSLEIVACDSRNRKPLTEEFDKIRESLVDVVTSVVRCSRSRYPFAHAFV